MAASDRMASSCRLCSKRNDRADLCLRPRVGALLPDVRVSLGHLRRHGIDPTQWRSGPTRAEFLRNLACTVPACGFFTADTVLLRRVYVLITEVDSRRVSVSGIAVRPGEAWLVRARNLTVRAMCTPGFRPSRGGNTCRTTLFPAGRRP